MRWTTIGLSAAQQHHIASEPTLPTVNRKNRIATIWIPAILALGLLTVFAYLGVRIVAAKSAAPEPIIEMRVKSVPTPAAIPKPVPAKKPPPTRITEAASGFTVITPQAGERYLQVAAVNSHMVLKYVDDLHKLNFEAAVAPGPNPDVLRILVGPFADGDAMDRAKAQLELAGNRPFPRSY